MGLCVESVPNRNRNRNRKNVFLTAHWGGVCAPKRGQHLSWTTTHKLHQQKLVVVALSLVLPITKGQSIRGHHFNYAVSYGINEFKWMTESVTVWASSILDREKKISHNSSYPDGYLITESGLYAAWSVPIQELEIWIIVSVSSSSLPLWVVSSSLVNY